MLHLMKMSIPIIIAVFLRSDLKTVGSAYGLAGLAMVQATRKPM